MKVGLTGNNSPSRISSGEIRGDKNGQSLVEVLIAIVVLTVGLTAAASAILGTQSISVDSEEANVALRLAEENLETLEAQARNNFAGLASSTTVFNEFTEQLIVSSTGPYSDFVTSRVTWQTDPLRVQKVELNAVLTNWYGYQATGGNTGGGGLSGNWQNPKTLGSINLGPNEQATNLNVKNAVVYLTTSVSNVGKPNFFIVDATNGSSPVVDSSLSTGSTGLNDVIVAGHYAYVANASTSAQLQVIDVSNNSSPAVVASLTLAGVSGSGAVGASIAYWNSRVYIGTDKAAGPEFHIVDVSNPLNPVEVGSYEVGASVNAIATNGTYAYLATSDTSAQLKILNIANPAAIAPAGSYNPAGGVAGQSLYLTGNTLYLGMLNNNQDGFYVLDVSSSTSPQVQGSAYVGSDVNGLAERSGLLFLATSDTNNEFQIWNVSNPASITLVSEFNFPNIAEGIDYENNLVYAAVRSNDALRIITSQ